MQKIFFLFFNFQESKQLNFGDWIGVFVHGFRLDVSATAYLIAIPLLFMTFFSFFDFRITRAFLKIYNYAFLFMVLYLGVVDMELYSWWGIKLDVTPLIYLKTPKEAAASLKIVEISLLVLLFVFLYFISLKAYKKFIFSSIKHTEGHYWKFSIAGLLLSGFLIIPLRGGVGIAPINPGSAYFSQNRFANHSAVNVAWNFMYSVVERKNYTTSHHYMDDAKAEALFRKFYPSDSTNIKVIKKNSNVLLVILESFSNKIIGELGGEPGITPEIDKICKNAIVFKNFFASGDRSEKGMLSIFSGFPSQPTTSIINFPSKTQNLPYLKAPFHERGYYTAFYYGGDMNFANFRSYFTNSSEDKLITLNDFPSKLHTQKWGVPDEFLFDKIATDLDTISKPFFVSCFTLSSHEPYDAPFEPVFPVNNRNDLSKNAFHYTDKSLGAFIAKAKTSKWWENTLIIIVADHGSRYPGNTPNHKIEKYNIPMIWTGGAILSGDTSITTYASQTDIARTLLNQFDLPAIDYPFSKDIFAEKPESFAMYFFNNGFGLMSDSSKVIYDNTINDFIFISGNVKEEFKESSKAYLQVLSNDFNSR